MDAAEGVSGRQSVTPKSRLRAGPPTRLRLPGRYLIQISALRKAELEVQSSTSMPDFSKIRFASGLMLQFRSRRAPITDKGIADLVPFTPTTIRAFHGDDDVGVFLRIYEGGKGPLAPVQVSAKVRDESDAVRSSHDAVLATDYFSEVRSADVELSLPLAQLSTGQYLLEVEAQSGNRRVQRTARFTGDEARAAGPLDRCRTAGRRERRRRSPLPTFALASTSRARRRSRQDRHPVKDSPLRISPSSKGKPQPIVPSPRLSSRRQRRFPRRGCVRPRSTLS